MFRSVFYIIALIILLPVLSLADGDIDAAPASPKEGWGDFEVVEESVEQPLWAQALLWPVNRLIDFYDIFRVDVGIGVSYGGVVRLTRYGQAGYRKMRPGSLRIGAFGRRPPAIIEEDDLIGSGSDLTEGTDREVCHAEFGAGVDLFVPALYAGICGEELGDFLLGLIFLDPMDDDFR